MPPFVTALPDATFLTGIQESVTDHARSFTPYSINLIDEQKKGMRTMAAGREGYARLVSSIATQHLNSLPRNMDPGLLADRLNYDASLEKVRQALMTLLEMISETQMANSADIMKTVDDFAKALQISRNDTAALDTAMREVDDWNSRFANAGDAPPAP